MNENQLYDLAELFKIFGDSTRIRILYCLFNQEKAVNQIAQELNLTISAVSHQLRILKHNKLIKARRDGKNIYYSLDDQHVVSIIEMAKQHIME